VGHWPLEEQLPLHWPAAQIGVEPEHCAPVVHEVPGFGSHAPFVHVEPVGHVEGEVAHEGTHSPSSQTSPDAHWLEYSHAFVDAVHAPATQTWFVAHSVSAVHGHGPSVPPQVGPESWPASGVEEEEESAADDPSVVVPGEPESATGDPESSPTVIPPPLPLPLPPAMPLGAHE
jgi:hypothetical protein